MSNLIEVVVSSKDDTGTGFKSADKGAKDLSSSFDRVGESADGAESKAQGFSDTLTGTKDVAGGLGEIMKGNLFEGFVQVGQGAADLAGGMASFLIPAIKNGVTGFKAAAVAAKAFTLSLLTNPIFLIGTAIVALVAGLIILYKKSETARNIMTAAFSAIGSAILDMVSIGLKGTKLLLNGFLDMVSGILHAVAKIPGPTQNAAKKAAKEFDEFKNGVSTTLDKAIDKVDDWNTKLKNMPKVAKLQGNITDLEAKLKTAKTKLGDKSLTATKRSQIQADIRQLQQRIADAKTALASIKNKTVTITYRSNSGTVFTQNANQLGSAGRNASGSIFGGGVTWVGENGPELAEFPPGTKINSNPTSMVKANQSRGGASAVTLVIKSGGSKMEDLFVELLKKYVRVEGGGDVQIALGGR